MTRSKLLTKEMLFESLYISINFQWALQVSGQNVALFIIRCRRQGRTEKRVLDQGARCLPLLPSLCRRARRETKRVLRPQLRVFHPHFGQPESDRTIIRCTFEP